MSERLRLRAKFDHLARLYDDIRPTYPGQLFTDLAELTGIGQGTRVLEIGGGTGQASVPLAQLGCELLVVELGPHLAEIAATRLAPYPARIVVADFDRWTPDDTGFHAVFSATAFHWLDPATRYRRTAELLAPGGFLVNVTTLHVAGGTMEFFEDVQYVYRRYYPESTLANGPQPAGTVPNTTHPGLADHYRQPVYRRYEWDREYTTAQYIDVLRTYSATFCLPPPTQAGLLRDIATLIDGRYGGRITKRYVFELRIARKK